MDRIGDGIYEEIVRRIVERMQPQRIVLFGSRARGDAVRTAIWTCS
jgi:predicted nucleotidyltransferase